MTLFPGSGLGDTVSRLRTLSLHRCVLFQAKSLTEPFAYDQYRKKKVREKIEAERANRVKLAKVMFESQSCANN